MSGELPRLHVLVSERELDGPSGLAAVQRVLERAAPVAVHLRARLPTRRLFEVATALAPSAVRTGGWVIVNGRPDVAVAAGARAVQLGRAALGVRATRRMVAACGGSLAIGASVHDAKGAVQAVRDGADYLVLGTIYATPSHPGRAGSGPTAVAEAVEEVGSVAAAAAEAPILGIGGLRADRIREVAAAGAYGIVVGRAVWSAPDPPRAAADLARELG